MSTPQSSPRTVDEALSRIIATRETLPKRLRQCADFIMANPGAIAVSTVADVAAGSDVPPSAVMRFCQSIGFSGYSEMQKLFRDAYAQRWPDYETRIKNLKSTGAGSPMALLAEFVEAGRLSLDTLTKSVEEAALMRAVAQLSAANMLHIIGYRRAFPAASYLAYAFEKLDVPAMLHDGAGKLDHRQALRSGDALIAISFAPYSGETIEMAQFAAMRGLPVIALTDAYSSPLAQSCSAVLTLEEVDFGAFRSLSATLALSITLAVAVASARG